MTEPGDEASSCRIVVGIDDSSSAKAALRWAVRLAPTLDAEVEAVTVWSYPTTYGWPAGLLDVWRPDVDAAKLLQEVIDEVCGPNRPACLHTAVLEGRPAEVLLNESENAALLVVGSRGHGGFAGLALGSVSGACAAYAHCPVLVVHQPASPRADQSDTGNGGTS